MALTLHVNGTASIFVGTQSDGSLEELGVSEDGVTVDLVLHTEDVRVDVFGPQMPLDVQYFLEEAQVTADLIWYDNAILNKVITRLYNNTPYTPGVEQAAGTLILQQGHWIRLLVKSTPSGTGVTASEPCWNFPTAFLTSVDSFKLGTRKTIHRLTFRCLVNANTITGDQSTGTVLYNHICT